MVLYDIKGKFKRVGFFDKNLLELVGYIVDFIDNFLFGFIDVFNYIIFNKFDYDGKKLKGYKIFEDYRFFYDGYVESLEYNYIVDNSVVCVFRVKVKFI